MRSHRFASTTAGLLRAASDKWIESLECRQFLSAAPSMPAQPAIGSVPVGNSFVVGLSPSQIRGAYGIDKIRFGSIVGDGTGQTIAIVNAFDNPKLLSSTDANFANSDLAKFDKQFGLPDPPSFLKVNQNGTTQYPPADTTGHWANEAVLDVEWVHAIAPKANIILVECFSANLTDLIQAGAGWASENPSVSVITMSFAASEASGETYYDSFMQTPSEHQGITFVAASGDNGSQGAYPAFSSGVLSVGATSLTLNNGAYGSEIGRSASGGGISQFEDKPDYQFAVTQSSSKRTSPDVAFNGDPNNGVAVYDSYNGGDSNPWYKVGGTSFAAPVWAALIATANQGRSLLGLGTLDGATQTLPRLYKLPANDFHDITAGNNGFAAGTGYDLVTGRGTPRAELLIPHLASGSTVTGKMFYDGNANGSINTGEAALVGWGCFIDYNNNGVFDSSFDRRVFSDANGNYSFGDLPGGTYTIRQNTPAGWKRTTPASTAFAVTLAYGQTVNNLNIGNVPMGSIAGKMFNDAIGSGKFDPKAAPLVGWGCYIDFKNNGIFDGNDVRAFSDANGNFSFNNFLWAGTYYLRQNTPAGWKRTTPVSLPLIVKVNWAQTTTGVYFGNQKI